MNRLLVLVFLVAGISSVASAQTAPAMDLSGQWRFALDREDVGMGQQWFTKDLASPDTIKIPGILQGQGYGDDISVDTPWVAALPRDMKWYTLPQYAPYIKPGHVKMPYLSQPPKHYLGVAWYQREIDIPAADAGKREHLLLERPRWGSTVWLDEREVGTGNSLVAPHEFELGILPAEKHRLTVRLDNRMTVFANYRPDGHGVSDALGATWNGMVGRVEIQATSPVYIDDVQVFPNLEKKSVLLKVHVGNATGKAGAGTVTAGAASAPVQWTEKGGDAELEAHWAGTLQTWDEFHPVLAKLNVKLEGPGASDSREVQFGLREISHDGKTLLLNGHEMNLRMTHWGGDFALTGYPATDVATWKKIIQTCKDYGLNGFRFHSWCPPEAAFEAADELGFYIQPECGMWNDFSKPGMMDMLQAETTRMERAYGNHPSYILLSPSNEPAGNSSLTALCTWAGNWYQSDPRRLYAGGTGRFGTTPGPTYMTSAARGQGGWFGKDYSAAVARSTIPVLGHEVGQWCVYPDFDVIKKFTGYLRPGNYEIWRDFATMHGVLANNKALAWASGKFSAECYKQEIEANLRTVGLSGIQLLELHDYLGQGGALIGMLDAFWEPKGFITAEEFRRFCAPVVPLARMRTSLYRTGDAFSIPVEMANYSEGPIANATPYWKIVDLGGKVSAEGTWGPREIPIGKGIALGTVEADLSKLAAPAEYKLVVGIAGTKAENDWKFWVYPAELPAVEAADVLVTTDWTQALARLGEGGKVFFTPPANMLDNSCPPLARLPIFWNRVMNNTGGNGLSAGGFLGLLVDPKSAALAEFPTESYCDLQWTDIVNGVRAINVENAPPELQPIVQAIDDWNRGFKLGVVFECNVEVNGKTGKLLVSAINLQSNPQNVVAQQLRHSLLAYAAGARFAPKVTLTTDQANALWPSTRPASFKSPAMPAFSTIPNFNPGDVVEDPPIAPPARP